MARTQIDKSLIASVNSSSVVGTTTNDSAAAGIVGQVISSTVGATNAPTTNTFGDLTSISLTAGDWDVSASAVMNTNQAAAVSEYDIGISSTSGNSSAGLNDPSTSISVAGTFCASNQHALTLSVNRVSLTATTTYYLKYKAIYTGSIPSFRGYIFARRAR